MRSREAVSGFSGQLSSSAASLAALASRSTAGSSVELDPGAKPRNRRQRDEGLDARQFAANLLDDLLDEEIAEGDAGEALLAVRDRIEGGRPRLVPSDMRALLGEQRGDRGRRLDRQRDLDEDQRLVDQRRVEKGVAAAVRRIDAPPEFVPVADFMHRLVADDLLEDRRRRRPVDPAQHEKAAIEPGAEEVLKIAVDDGEAAVAAQGLEEVGAHRDERRRAARSAVEAAEELLPARLRRIVDLARRRSAAGRAEARHRILDPAPVGPEIVGQGAKEGALVGLGEVAVAGEDLAGQRNAGSFATPGEERAAHVGERTAVAGAARPCGQL